MIKANQDMILGEARQINGFMTLLMKQRNTGVKWTQPEKAELRSFLRHLSGYVPLAVVFLLPFGSLLIPVLAQILDRRKTARTAEAVLK
jgi:hypothetical protein